MAKIKTTLCVTLKNEQKSVEKFVDSLLSQTIFPDEFIIVDGGSSDDTVKILKGLIKAIERKGIKVLIIENKSLSIPKARNLAIKRAKNEFILISDLGCILSNNWTKNMIESLSRGNKIVAGVYELPYKNSFQKIAGNFLGISSDLVESDFIPSTRSVAMAKEVWRKIGGFDEKLFRGEDTKFFSEAIKYGYKIFINKKARVEWSELKNLTINKFIKKIFHYAQADVLTKIWFHPSKKLLSHNIKALSIFVRYLVFFISIVLILLGYIPINVLVLELVLYGLFIYYKLRSVIENIKELLIALFTQLISDFSVMLGFSWAITKNIWKK